MGNGSGTAGHPIHMELGRLSDPSCYIKADGSGNGDFLGASWKWQVSGAVNFNAANVQMNGGVGSGGNIFQLDGATLDTGTLAGTSPANHVTPVAYWPIMVNGVAYWINLYQ